MTLCLPGAQGWAQPGDVCHGMLAHATKCLLLFASPLGWAIPRDGSGLPFPPWSTARSNPAPEPPRQMTLYIEACESGSLFDGGLLDDSLRCMCARACVHMCLHPRASWLLRWWCILLSDHRAKQDPSTPPTIPNPGCTRQLLQTPQRAVGAHTVQVGGERKGALCSCGCASACTSVYIICLCMAVCVCVWLGGCAWLCTYCAVSFVAHQQAGSGPGQRTMVGPPAGGLTQGGALPPLPPSNSTTWLGKGMEQATFLLPWPTQRTHTTGGAPAGGLTQGGALPPLPPSNSSAWLDTCMGDLFSVAWMEDSETQDVQQETLQVRLLPLLNLLLLLLLLLLLMWWQQSVVAHYPAPPWCLTRTAGCQV